MRTTKRRALGIVSMLLAVASACNADGTRPEAPTSSTTSTVAATTTTSAPTTTPGTSTSAVATTVAAAARPLTTRPGVEQLAILDAEPGGTVEVVDAAGSVVVEGSVDEQGAFLARQLEPGIYEATVTSSGATFASGEVTVRRADDVPPQSFYDNQALQPGFGYLTTRDGTTLSMFVSLPGDASSGPYPTVVEYSGYSPSNPDGNTFASLFNALGYAYVGVNMRGTGCSGGSWRFFETAQNVDGYDIVETVAAQPWVQAHRVGLVGVSFPGISQLFVAATQPPSLAVITPLSVLDDSYRSTLYPGGILNTGFAVPWLTERVEQSAPYGQAWTKVRADGGDAACAANQELRLQNPDMLAEVQANPFYDPTIGDAIAPTTFVDRINVPVFIAGAWQDEQTGGHFPAMLDRFTGSPHVYATMLNGLHTESISPAVLPRLVEFLDLYVAQRVPSLQAARAIAPVLASTLYGTGQVTLPPDRFDGMTYEEALAEFEAEPPIQVLFEEGAAEDEQPGAPMSRFSAGFDAWPVPTAEATTWYLGDRGELTADPPAEDGAASTYTADPTALPATFYSGSGNAIWRYDTTYDWQPIPDGLGSTFTSQPLDDDTVIVGSGSVDVWVAASAADTDLEVTISEVRGDGSEVYVQSGWLRASHRALDDGASTATRPVHTDLQADGAPLVPGGAPVLARVEVFPFAHAFRAGSSLRLTIDAPGNNRAVWAFDTISAGEQVTIHHDATYPSALVLDVVPDIDVPGDYPPCGSLRGQPCRS